MAPDFQLFTSLRYDPLLPSLEKNVQDFQPGNSPSSPFYMLPYHRDRLTQAAHEFGWTAAADTISTPQGLTTLEQRLVEACGTEAQHPLKVKVLLDVTGSITVQTTPVPEVSQWNLYPSRLPSPRDAARPYVSPLTGGALELGDGDTVHGDPPREGPWEVVPDDETTTPSAYTSFKTTKREMYDSARERAGVGTGAEKREVLIVSDRNGEVMEGSLTTPYFWRNERWTTPALASGGQAGTTRRWAVERGLCVEGVVKADELVDGEECWLSNGVRGFQWGKVRLRRMRYGAE